MIDMDDLLIWLREQIDLDKAWASTLPEEGGQIYNGDAWVPVPDRARMLREAEVKQRRLDEFAKTRAWLFTAEDPTVKIALGGMCTTWDAAIRIDATVYAERPGYREQWKP